jgi:NTE family protein
LPIKRALDEGVINPVNWLKLSSGTFGRSDLSAEYYDKHLFERGTFGDMAARKGPVIVINAVDMFYGTRVEITQDAFDLTCSDLSHSPVARAAAAPSAVLMALVPSLYETMLEPLATRWLRSSRRC